MRNSSLKKQDSANLLQLCRVSATPFISAWFALPVSDIQGLVMRMRMRRPLTVKRTWAFISAVEQFPDANIRTYKEIKSL